MLAHVVVLLLVVLEGDAAVSEGLCRATASSAWLERAAMLASAVGNPLPVTALAIGSSVLAVLRKQYWGACVLLAVPYAATTIATFLKNAVARPRPEFACAAMMQWGFSWPSGHAVGATTGLLLVALFLGQRLARREAFTLSLIAVVVAEAVSWSRVALGAHYLSDILAGQVWGGLSAVLGSTLVASLSTDRRYK